MKKGIFPYGDCYGNTCEPKAILFVKEGKSYKGDNFAWDVIEPSAYKKQCSKYSLDQIFILPDNAPEKVGLYSTATHYQILKKYGQTKLLNVETTKYFDKLTREDDKNVFCKWSKGLIIKNPSEFLQEELY